MNNKENNHEKKYPTIACCGIDCGLCPTYYIKGPSKCPGCYGPNFLKSHPSCSIINCCIKIKGYETCAECNELICEKLKEWDKCDSFVCHRKSLENLRYIKNNSLEDFLSQQKTRKEILKEMLDEFNDGRSKSFFCISTTLLPIPNLKNAIKKIKQKLNNNIEKDDIKTKSKILKDILNKIAKEKGIILKLKKT
ncbi:MAG: DUF3795 domain-containing protein [Candidatus Lokiarchaeota archaeon]|nr:DUF3795 domain-containing protein [Candidatus Lokiarchaeota archaeon]